MNVAMDYFLVVAVALFASMATVNSAAEATKVLHFPADQYMGHLSVEDPCLGSGYIEGGRDLSFPFGFDPKRVCLAGDWDFVAQAQGDVAVPVGRNLQLNVGLRLRERDSAKIRALPPAQYKIFGAERCRLDPDDLTGLSRLSPDDLHTLRISSLVRTADADQRVLDPICHLTGLQVLSLYRTGITDSGLERLKALRGLRALELKEERITVSGLEVLKDLPDLEYFDMYPGTTDAGLKCVAQAKSLRWLRLSMGRIWGPGLTELAQLPRLERLSLWGTTGLTDRHISFLEGLPHLKSLTLWGTDVPLTDACLASIGKLTSLEELHFIRISTQFTDAGIRHLENLVNLRKLSFTFLQVGAEEVQCLANIPRLESLKGLAPTADAARALPSLRTLKALDVNWVIPPIGTRVPPEVVAAVGQLGFLEELRVMGGRWSQEDLLVLGNLSNLKRLSLGMMHDDLGEPVLAKIAELRNLDSLNLLGGTVSKQGLNRLNSLTKLRDLYVQVYPKASLGIDETPLNLSDLANLKTLSLAGLALQDGDLASLAALDSLESLGIDGRLTDGGLRHIAGFKDLEALCVKGTFTDAGLRHMQDLSRLKNVDLRGISCPTGSGLAHLKGLTRLADMKLAGQIPNTALNHLEGLPSLWSLTVETDEVIQPETASQLRERLPSIEYIHINKPTRFDRAPVPVKQTPVRRSPRNVPRHQRRR